MLRDACKSYIFLFVLFFVFIVRVFIPVQGGVNYGVQLKHHSLLSLLNVICGFSV